MEPEPPKPYPSEAVTIRRSKHVLSVLARYYIAIGLYFAIFCLIYVLMAIFDDKIRALDDSIPILIGLAFVLSVVFSLLHKGSLVETVHIDYVKQEIRVLRYTCWGRQRKVVIPFKGFSWDVMPGGRGPDRLRLFPLVDNRIVICEDTLGWTYEDCQKLEAALSEIVDKDYWLNKI